MAPPALVPTTNGNQSTVLSVATTMQPSTNTNLNSNLKSNSNSNTNSNPNDEEAVLGQHQVDNNKSTSPKPNAMNSLKLTKMGSVSKQDKRVYKIVLTGGKLEIT